MGTPTGGGGRGRRPVSSQSHRQEHRQGRETPEFEEGSSNQAFAGQLPEEAAADDSTPFIDAANEECRDEPDQPWGSDDSSWASPLDGDQDGDPEADIEWLIADTSALEAKLEECKGLFDDNEEGMFLLLQNATDAELHGLVDKGVAEKWLGELWADQAYEIRQRMYPANGVDNIVARFQDERWYESSSGAYDALVKLNPAERQEAWVALTDAGLVDKNDEQLEKLCNGTEADAMQVRLDLATGMMFDGTDEDGVATALSGAASLGGEQQALRAQLANGDLSEEEAVAIEARLAQIGDASGLIDGTADTDFLDQAAWEVSRDEMGAALQAGGADQDLVAKQYILGAEGWVDDDETAMMRAIASVHDEDERRALLQDEQVDAAIDPLWGGLSEGTVDALEAGDSYTVVQAELRDLATAMIPDRAAIIERIARMKPEERARLAADAGLMGMLKGCYGVGIVDPGDWAQAIEVAVEGGQVPTDWILDDATKGMGDDSELVNAAYASMAPHDREAVQRAYLLINRGIPESQWSDEDRDAIARYEALEGPISDLSSDHEQDEAKDAMLGEQDPSKLQSAEGRRDLADTWYFRQLERMEVESGVLTPNADQTLGFAHEMFVAAYNETKGKELTEVQAFELLRLDTQFWEKANDQAAANAFAAELAGSIAAAAVCVAVAFIPGVGPAAAGGLYASLSANAGLISAAALFGGIAKAGTAELAGGDFNDGEEAAPAQIVSGSVEVVAGVVGAHLAANVLGSVGLSGPKLAGHLAKGAGRAAKQGVGRSIATGALEGAIDGAVGGVMGDVTMTALDAETYKRGVWQALSEVSTSTVQGLVVGAATGGVLGGGFSGAARGLTALRGIGAPHPDAAAFETGLKEALPPDVRDAIGNRARVDVLGVDGMTELVGSRSGEAVIFVDGDAIYVFVREGASPAVMAEEAIHLEQLLDGDLEGMVRSLYERVPRKEAWQGIELPERVELYQTKVEIEIDAQRRLIDRYTGDPTSAQLVDDAEIALEDLLMIQEDLSKLTPEDLVAGNVPWVGETEPPWLFGKRGRYTTEQREYWKGLPKINGRRAKTPHPDTHGDLWDPVSMRLKFEEGSPAHMLAPNGVQYDAAGDPKLVDWAQQEVKITGFSDNRDANMRLARDQVRELTGNDNWVQPDGWTWHELRDMETMILVPTVLHDAVPHTGGVSMAKSRQGRANAPAGGSN